MKKYIGVTILIAALSSVYLINTEQKETYVTEMQMPWLGSVMPCYHPRDWLENEEDGGTWTIVEQPDNGGLTSIDVAGDNPCVPINDCGPFEFEYCVECDSCENLKDCIRVAWDVPCCPPDPNPTCVI